MQGDKERYLGMGMSGYISKPIAQRDCPELRHAAKACSQFGCLTLASGIPSINERDRPQFPTSGRSLGERKGSKLALYGHSFGAHDIGASNVHLPENAGAPGK